MVGGLGFPLPVDKDLLVPQFLSSVMSPVFSSLLDQINDGSLRRPGKRWLRVVGQKVSPLPPAEYLFDRGMCRDGPSPDHRVRLVPPPEDYPFGLSCVSSLTPHPSDPHVVGPSVPFTSCFGVIGISVPCRPVGVFCETDYKGVFVFPFIFRRPLI